MLHVLEQIHHGFRPNQYGTNQLIFTGGNMLKFFITTLGILSALVLSPSAATKFPFPQQRTYPSGILPEGIDHKHVQTIYDIWLKGYYTESGDQARIKFDEPENTVSEGIGYGMLIMVYMDNAKNNTQAKFDKLWNYYKAHSNNGLMDWKISGFGGTIGGGAATDAELDAAVALIMAYEQWGDEKYLNEAKTLIGNVYAQEVKSDYLVGGSQWVSYNPSYMSIVALELFKEVDGSRWNNVVNTSYTLLDASQHNQTGLWPNWCDINGNPGGGVGNDPTVYGFDAARTPWRIGWAYLWHGHSQAKALSSKVVDWFISETGNTPGLIGQKYNLDGSIATGAGGNMDNIPTFLGPLVVGGVVDPKYQDWVNKGYNRLRAFGPTDDNYYNETLELLCMLLLTGNMPNFRTITPHTTATLEVTATPNGAGTLTISPDKPSYSIGEQVTITTAPSGPNFTFVGWSGDYVGTALTATVTVDYNMKIQAVYKDETAKDLVDDCEDNDAKTNMGTDWFTYTDAADAGASVVTPLTGGEDAPFTMAAGGYESNYAAKIEFSLDQGGFEYDPFVGIGFQFNEDQVPEDVSAATGISFYYKGSFGGANAAIYIECATVTEPGANYGMLLEPSADWKEMLVTWDDFLQPSWAEPVELDMTQVENFHWQIQGDTGDSGELWLDNIRLIGYEIASPIKNPAQNKFKENKAIRFSQLGNQLEIQYFINQDSYVSLELYDLSGKLVQTLEQGNKAAGNHSVLVSASEKLNSHSLYIAKLKSETREASELIMMQ